MNALIKQTLEERAGDGPAPYVDVAALEAVGRGRVRRRRVAGSVGALAVLATVGVATPYLVSGIGGADQGQVAVDGPDFSQAAVAWSVGSTVHVGEETVELPKAPQAYLLNDDGIVWTDAERGVNVTAGGRTEQIGVSTTPYGRVLVAEGSLAAWYDGNEQAFTVVDTASQKLVRQVPVTLDGPQDGEFEGPSVRALSDGVLWFYADREATGVDVASGDVVDSFGARSNEQPADVRAGHLVLDGRGDKDTVVSIAGGIVGTVPGGGRAVLSPDARYVVTDANDSEQVYDVASGEDVTPDFGHDFQAVVQWLDNDRYQAIAYDVVDVPDGQERGPVDILVCSVSATDCEVVAESAVAQGQRFGVPVGESVS